MPTFSAMSGVIGQRFAWPRIPSVPKKVPIYPIVLCLLSSRTAGPGKIRTGRARVPPATAKVRQMFAAAAAPKFRGCDSAGARGR